VARPDVPRDGHGHAPLAIVGSAYGFTQPATPLQSLLAIGLPGGDVLVTPGITDVLVPAGGTVTSAIVIPSTPSAAGFVCCHQPVPMELSGVLQLSGFSSTNALAVTVGT
jgi:hypothetical protein